MVEKTLSSGTLNLRFMQNARGTAPVRPEQAHVKDDGEWEVSPETRLAWPYRGEKASVTYDTSYLPFLFPSLHDTPAADKSPSPSDTRPPRGRRVFNKCVTNEHANRDQPGASASQPTPRSASADAKNIIFDMSRVGADLGRSCPIQAAAFVRPAAVDAPAETASHPSSDTVPKRSRTSGDGDKARKKTKHSPIE